MKNLFAAIFGASWFLYVKLALVAGAVVGAGYLAWDYRGAIAEKQQQKAVTTAVSVAVTKIQKDLETERELRKHYQGLADEKLAELLQTISNIKITNKTIENNIYHEVESNPAFYQQPLPDGGYEQWKRTRLLSQGQSESDSSSP